MKSRDMLRRVNRITPRQKVRNDEEDKLVNEYLIYATEDELWEVRTISVTCERDRATRPEDSHPELFARWVELGRIFSERRAKALQSAGGRADDVGAGVLAQGRPTSRPHPKARNKPR